MYSIFAKVRVHSIQYGTLGRYKNKKGNLHFVRKFKKAFHVIKRTTRMRDLAKQGE